MPDRFRTIPPQARMAGRQYAQVVSSDRYVEVVETKIGNEIVIDGKKYRPVLPSLVRGHAVNPGVIAGVPVPGAAYLVNDAGGLILNDNGGRLLAEKP